MKRTALRRKTPLKARWRPTIVAGNRFAECARCHFSTFTDVHHLIPRGRGGDDNQENLVRLCRACHSWVHANPAAATEAGLMKPWTHEEAARQAYRERVRLAELIPDLGNL